MNTINISSTTTGKNDSHLRSDAGSNNVLEYNGTKSCQTNDVFALARAFLSISSMTHKKLQKLCYYAKAWHLALYGNNLISEHFEAWVHGAVQPQLYSFYKKYEYRDIPRCDSTANIPETFLYFAKEIFNAYGHLTGDELERVNHQEDPWLNARGHLRPWESCTNVISESDMRDYYRKMMI